MNSKTVPTPLNAMFAVPEHIYQWNESLQSIELEFDEMDEIRRLLIVHKGTFLIRQHHNQTNKSVSMKSGDLIAIPTNTSLCIRSAPQKLASCSLIEYRLTGSGNSFLNSPTSVLLRDQVIIAEAAKQLATDWYSSSMQPWHIHMAFLALIQQIDNSSNNSHQAETNWIEDSLDYILLHYKEELSRELLAQRAGVSPEHFSRMFHKRTGYKLIEYITLIRIRRAQELLLSTKNTTLDQVALQTGFRDGLYLSRRFKQTVGVSPHQYRHTPIISPGALNINHSASLWALGIQPQIGVFTNWHKNIYGATAPQCANSLLHGTYTSGHHSQLPDVIVSYQLQQQTIDLLKLAPIVQLSHRQLNWKEQFRSIAELVHKTKQAEAILLPIEESANRLRESIHYKYGQDKSVIIWELHHDVAYAISQYNGRGAHLLYGDLGFQMPQALINNKVLERGYLQVSLEELDRFDADFIFFTGMPSTTQTTLTFNQTLQSSAWKKLKAVQANQVYMLRNADLFWGYDPLSTKDQLVSLRKVLFPELSQ